MAEQKSEKNLADSRIETLTKESTEAKVAHEEAEVPIQEIDNVKRPDDDDFPVFVSFDRETRKFWIWIPVPSSVKIWVIVFFTVKIEVVFKDGKKKKLTGEKGKAQKYQKNKMNVTTAVAPIRLSNGYIEFDGETIYIDSVRGSGRWDLPHRIIDKQYWLPPGAKASDYPKRTKLGWRIGDFPEPGIEWMRRLYTREKKNADDDGKKVKHLKLTYTFDIYIFEEINSGPGGLLGHIIVQVTITFPHKKRDAQKSDSKKEERKKEGSLGWNSLGDRKTRPSSINEWLVTNVKVIDGARGGVMHPDHEGAWVKFKGKGGSEGINGYKPDRNKKKL